MKNYRLYMTQEKWSQGGMIDALPCGDLKPTRITFKACNDKDAEIEMLKIASVISDGHCDCFGFKEETQPNPTHNKGNERGK